MNEESNHWYHFTAMMGFDHQDGIANTKSHIVLHIQIRTETVWAAANEIIFLQPSADVLCGLSGVCSAFIHLHRSFFTFHSGLTQVSVPQALQSVHASQYS